MNLKKPKILVVDDLPDWQETISGLLRDENYEVQIAGSVGDALSLLKTTEFDLAVLDLRMDESDEDNTEGLELAENIRQLCPAVKIIILTGYSTPERLERAMVPNDAGQRLVDDYLEKAESENLVSVIRSLLNK